MLREPTQYATRSLVALAFIPVTMGLAFVVGSISGSIEAFS